MIFLLEIKKQIEELKHIIQEMNIFKTKVENLGKEIEEYV